MGGGVCTQLTGLVFVHHQVESGASSGDCSASSGDARPESAQRCLFEETLHDSTDSYRVQKRAHKESVNNAAGVAAGGSQQLCSKRLRMRV
eukprot:5143727-Prymnesium_polylepis.1